MVPRILAALVLASALLHPATARAGLLAPETGAWWSPATSGTGVQIEVQDNLISLTYFGYDARGQAVFYLMAGRWDPESKAFSADVNAFSNGTCVGCPFNPPIVTTIGRGSAQFTSRSRGTLTLPRSGSTPVAIPIERFSFAYGSTPEFQQLGLWMTTILFPIVGVDGEVVVMDELDEDAGGPFVRGRLFPGGTRVIGERLVLPGSATNFVWAFDINAELSGYYVGEISLDGIVGTFSVVRRNEPFPLTGGIQAFGSRITGASTINEVLGSAVPPSAEVAAEAGKRRALRPNQGSERVVGDADAAILMAAVERLQARLAAEQAGDRTE